MSPEQIENHNRLRLSAVRALLGSVYPDVRLVKVRWQGDKIEFVALCEKLSDNLREALRCVATGIIADFPEADFDEKILEWRGPLPVEHVFNAGWVYARAE